MRKIILVSFALALAACGKPAEQASRSKEETAEVRQATVAKAVPPPLALKEAYTGVPRPEDKSFASFSVYPYEGDKGKTHIRTGDTEFAYSGGTLASAISELMDTAQLVEYKGVDQKLLDGRYTVSCKILKISGADNRTRLRAMTVAGLNGAFPFTIKTVKEDRNLLVLKKISGAAGPARAVKPNAGSKSTISAASVKISVQGYHIEKLQKFLQDLLKVLVLDETAIEGDLDYDFETSSRDLKSVNAELKKIGLNLEKGRREIEIAMVTGIQPEQAKK